MAHLRSALCGAALAISLLSPASAYLGSYNGASGGSSGTGPPGPAGPTGPAGPAGQAILFSGYTAGPLYTPFMGPPQGAAIAALSTATGFCSPVYFPNIAAAGGGTGTIGSIGIKIGVAGTTSMQASLYTNDTSVSPYKPGTLLGSTLQAANTSTAAPTMTFSTGVSISANTLYWICLEVGDTTMTYATSAANATNMGYASQVGVSTTTFVGAITAPPADGVVINATGGYGTWPSTLHGVSMTENQGRIPWFWFQFTSIP